MEPIHCPLCGAHPRYHLSGYKPKLSRRKSNAERFWEKVDKSAGPDACWPWTASIAHWGYGSFAWRYEDGRVGGRQASRCALELHLGRPIPAHLEAAHECKNRACCNPAHLVEKTKTQNEADKARDGTKCQGVKHPTAVLTEAQVVEIRDIYRKPNPPSYRTHGRKLGVDQSAIRQVVLGLTWKSVPER